MMVNLFTKLGISVAFLAMHLYAGGGEPLKPPKCEDPTAELAPILSAAEKAKSQDEFLKSIQPGALSLFTFNTESHNGAISGAISEKWPGPVRASLDGRMIMRYTCDRKSPSYGKVDLIFRESDESPYQTLSLLKR